MSLPTLDIHLPSMYGVSRRYDEDDAEFRERVKANLLTAGVPNSFNADWFKRILENACAEFYGCKLTTTTQTKILDKIHKEITHLQMAGDWPAGISMPDIAVDQSAKIPGVMKVRVRFPETQLDYGLHIITKDKYEKDGLPEFLLRKDADWKF